MDKKNKSKQPKETKKELYTLDGKRRGKMRPLPKEKYRKLPIDEEE